MSPHLSRRGFVVGAMATSALPLDAMSEATRTGDPASLAIGINLAGAEFGAVPGVHGREYLYPELKNFDHFAQRGFTLVRLPFKWERLQPHLDAALDQAELAHLHAAVRAAEARGMTTVLDPHNYAKRRLAGDAWAQEHVIGSSAVPACAFASFWALLAHEFADKAHVHFGLMNEPVGVSAAAWRDIAQEAILAIRRTGARNMIYVPGTAYTGAHSWREAGNTAMASITDPAAAIAIDVHQYLDSNSSGTHADVVSSSIGSERLQEFQAWARANGVRALLGEFGAAKDARSVRALIDLLDEVAANRDVWLAVAAWAGGPRWPPDEMFNLEPFADGRSKPQTAVLGAFASNSHPLPPYDDLVPDLYLDRRRGHDMTSDEAARALSGLANDSFTLLVEVDRDLLASDSVVVGSASQPLLAIRAGRFAAATAQAALSSEAARTGRKVRCAIVIDREAQQVLMSATVGQVVRAPVRPSDAAHSLNLHPRLLRLTGFKRALPAEALAQLVF